MTLLLRQAIPIQLSTPTSGDVYVLPKGAHGRPIGRTSTGKFIDTTGSTTEGIQEAINEVKLTGGCVLLAPGTYSVKDILLSGAQGVTIGGAGSHKTDLSKGTILKAATGATNVL